MSESGKGKFIACVEHSRNVGEGVAEGSKCPSFLSVWGAGGTKVPLLYCNKILVLNKQYKQAKYDWKREQFI